MSVLESTQLNRPAGGGTHFASASHLNNCVTSMCYKLSGMRFTLSRQVDREARSFSDRPVYRTYLIPILTVLLAKGAVKQAQRLVTDADQCVLILPPERAAEGLNAVGSGQGDPTFAAALAVQSFIGACAA